MGNQCDCCNYSRKAITSAKTTTDNVVLLMLNMLSCILVNRLSWGFGPFRLDKTIFIIAIPICPLMSYSVLLVDFFVPIHSLPASVVLLIFLM